MSAKLGLVTIGQTPRDDIVPSMIEHLPPGTEVIQAGACDGLTAPEIAEMAPAPGDYVLITRLADGSAVSLGRQFLIPRLAAAVAHLEDLGCDLTAILCTGTFPELPAKRLVVEPERLFHATCSGLVGSKRLGALIPLMDQVPQAEARWREAGVDAVVVAASPYGPPDAVAAAAATLLDAGVAAVALDCFGYTESLRRLVRRATGCPTILANAYLARIVAELLT